MTTILGISAFYHDSAAAIIKDGEILAAAQEERFTRVKHDSSFPNNAISELIKFCSLNIKDIDLVIFYDKPFLKFERLLETYVANSPKGFNSFRKAMPIWLREKLFQKNVIITELKKHGRKFNENKVLFSEHHFSHAASAYYPSPFKEALVLTIDGVGEWATTSLALGKNDNLKIIKEIHFPHSIGLLYSAFTYFLGFKVNSGEYKVMGLAPYGKPIYKKIILEKIVNIKEDGSFFLNQKYFNYMTGLTMTNNNFSKLFQHPVRIPEKENLNQFHMDLAASIQSVVEDIILKITNSIYLEYKINNLCLAGGVALNCVANGKILKQNQFKNIWIQPAAGDAGGAIGAALGYWHNELKMPRQNVNDDNMKGSYLGNSFSQNLVEKELTECGAKFETLDYKKILELAAKALSEGKTIGWFQGRMEFGPRALGNRSILGDPRSDTMQKTLNLKVKFRESFRPFAPAVLIEDVNDWFEINQESPYMLLVDKINKKNIINTPEDNTEGFEKLKVKRSTIPAVTHVDYSARIQTVHQETNKKFYDLIKKFKEITNCSVLINTSFNIRGEPIVCTPKDAFDCFMGTNIEILIVENSILYKEYQTFSQNLDYSKKYELD